MQELHLRVQHLQEGHAPLVHVGIPEQVHAVLEVLHLDGGRDEIHEELEIVDGLEGPDGLLRREGRGMDDLAGPLLERIGEDLHLLLVLLREVVLLIGHPGHEIGLGRDDRVHMDPLESLQDGGQGAVRHLQGLDHLAHGAVRGEVPFGGVLDRHVRLRDGAQDAFPRLRVADQADGLLPADGHGEHRPRKDDGVAQGQDRDRVGKLGLVQLEEGGVADDRHDIHFDARLGIHFFKIIFHLLYVKSLGYDNLSYPMLAFIRFLHRRNLRATDQNRQKKGEPFVNVKNIL